MIRDEETSLAQDSALLLVLIMVQVPALDTAVEHQGTRDTADNGVLGEQTPAVVADTIS